MRKLLFWVNVGSLVLAVAIVRAAPRWEVITLGVALATAGVGTLNILVLVASERVFHPAWYWLSGLPAFVASGMLVIFGAYAAAVLTERAGQLVGGGALVFGFANASYLASLYLRVRQEKLRER